MNIGKAMSLISEYPNLGQMMSIRGTIKSQLSNEQMDAFNDAFDKVADNPTALAKLNEALGSDPNVKDVIATAAIENPEAAVGIINEAAAGDYRRLDALVNDGQLYEQPIQTRTAEAATPDVEASGDAESAATTTQTPKQVNPTVKVPESNGGLLSGQFMQAIQGGDFGQVFSALESILPAGLMEKLGPLLEKLQPLLSKLGFGGGSGAQSGHTVVTGNAGPGETGPASRLAEATGSSPTVTKVDPDTGVESTGPVEQTVEATVEQAQEVTRTGPAAAAPATV